ncbi:hypothetical protein [Alicyclobacillus contaminans]|uniref:hypothetical protein n=1 Tax=Alicyclobacillus contaminans TaxID=392016 RepID=UPI0012EB4B77|nr:hypothetical protein [Alicyclobacillus contaminans]
MERKARLFSNKEDKQKDIIQVFVEKVTATDNIDDIRINIVVTVRFLTGVEDGT